MAESFDLETIAMTLIGHAGESKSLAYQALYAAKKGNFDEAERFMEQAGEEMLKAHNIQTDLIVKEAGGEKIDIGLIMVHAQDHLMGAILFKDLVKEFIDLYKTVYDKK
ncbi:PTS lactose/cellobiose transporter subunit IIA [Leptotrichia sp. OH3620_COT-345]|uniref:PTS lactose/cellobiose transporter subunit IIA n=1 Tax=Leptotrichia sp. OH3620_COT-345 TaxID=2491048 RepID=UPI000F651E71|nr:PTS lactose/cellobiose transporter subunit IIA [Leptotrichia sp. OH3620_COT-345]RRD39382.1 PTS lactose/cellobiose transporter subunit IIA [Leptotrichia sp. OH3620_COT-345]